MAISIDFAAELRTSAISAPVSTVATYTIGNAENEVYELLGRHLGRSGQAVPQDFGDSLVFANEDGAPWQVKPSNPLIGKNGRPQKYLCPTGQAAGPYLPAVPAELRTVLGVPLEGSFWDAIEANPNIPIVITEGGKKALALMTAGLCAIALTGCDGSTVRVGDESFLDDRLARFFRPGRVVTIAFDQDVEPRTTARVSRATDKLTARIARTCPETLVKVASWPALWGKGIDDVSASRGVDAVLKIIKKAKRLVISADYLSPASPDAIYRMGKQGPSLKEPNYLADIIFLKSGGRLAYDLGTQSFYAYGHKYDGVWSLLDIIEAKAFVAEAIKTLTPEGVQLGYSDTTVSSVTNLLKGLCLSPNIGKPYDDGARDAEGKPLPRLIPMLNGVLNSQTRELYPHDKSYGHVNRLPYAYNPLALAPTPILDFLLSAQEGDEMRVQVLRAFMKALVTGQAYKLQRFLEVLGLGGTGKSTFTGLLQGLVGVENCIATSWDRIARNFTSISFQGKLLVYIADAEGFASPAAIALVRQMSGGDTIAAEQKNTPVGRGFRFRGLFMVTANDPFKCKEAVGSSTAGALSRRRASIYFNKQIDRSQMNRDLINVGDECVTGSFAQYLPALFNWALDMPDEDMEAFAVETDRICPSMRAMQQEVTIATSSLALWATESLTFQPQLKSLIGTAAKISVDTPGGRLNTYQNAELHLYPNYVLWCEQSGVHAVSRIKFAKDLEHLLVNDLGKNVSQGRTAKGNHFVGCAISGTVPEDTTPAVQSMPATVEALESILAAEPAIEIEYSFDADGNPEEVSAAGDNSTGIGYSSVIVNKNESQEVSPDAHDRALQIPGSLL
jgi:putative DNA primase/helicase